VTPPMPPKGSATAGTGRCTPLPNPHPGFRTAGHRIRSGRKTHRKTCRPTHQRPPPHQRPPRQTNTSNHREKGRETPGKYVTLNPDRVNLCVGRVFAAGRGILEVGSARRSGREEVQRCCLALGARVFARAFASL
jgi:hypothetical protein